MFSSVESTFECIFFVVHTGGGAISARAIASTTIWYAPITVICLIIYMRFDCLIKIEFVSRSRFLKANILKVVFDEKFVFVFYFRNVNI